MPKSNTSYQLDPSDQPDPDSNGARRMLGNLSKESIYRLAKKGEIDGYVLCGKRFWTLASLRATAPARSPKARSSSRRFTNASRGGPVSIPRPRPASQPPNRLARHAAPIPQPQTTGPPLYEGTGRHFQFKDDDKDDPPRGTNPQ